MWQGGLTLVFGSCHFQVCRALGFAVHPPPACAQHGPRRLPRFPRSLPLGLQAKGDPARYSHARADPDSGRAPTSRPPPQMNEVLGSPHTQPCQVCRGLGGGCRAGVTGEEAEAGGVPEILEEGEP